MRISTTSLRLKLVAGAALAFVPLTAIAMLAYHGGGAVGGSRGYQFFREPFSDLGMTRGYNGSSNLLPHLLFATSLSLIALAFMVSLPVWGRYAYTRTRSTSTKAALTVFGVLSATCFAGIAFAPVDTSALHGTFVDDAFLSLIAFLAILARAQWSDPAMRTVRWATLANAVIVVLFFANASVLAGHSPLIRYIGGVISQKVLVYVCLVNLFLQARALAARETVTDRTRAA